MTDETTHDTTECPSAEDLCAWFDGQLASAALDAHVDGCVSCKSIVKSYERIDKQIMENVERPTQRDMGILVRIKDGSMKEISGAGRAPWATPGFIIKILLSCIVIAGLISAIVMLPKGGGGSKGDKTPKAVPQPPTVQLFNQGDQALMKLAQNNAEAFAGTEVLALGTNPEILDPIVEDAKAETLRADVVCTWEAAEPSDSLRFLKALLPETYHQAFDEKILEASDYCTVVVTLTSADKRGSLDDLLKTIGCRHVSDSSVEKPTMEKPTIRYTFILRK